MLCENLETIKCWFVDFWDGFDPNDNPFTKILRKYYYVVLDSEMPDYLFCSIFYSPKGPKALQYSCVRIFYTGENFIPDFNIYDYAIGFDYIDYGDRYLRWPLYRFYYDDFENALKKHTLYDMKHFMERDFCCRVVSKAKSEYREAVFMEINERKHVASGGRCKNNLPQGKSIDNKREFLHKFKFNLALENANTPGYVTEKIVQAWAAGCIPIYWGGGGKIGKEFNKAAFIDCSDFATTTELIEYLEYLEYDEKALKKILTEPIYMDGQFVKDRIFEEFLINIIEKGKDVKNQIRRLSPISGYAKRQEDLYLSR